MIEKCTTCSRPAQPTARYCPFCYTVFPSKVAARRGRAVGGQRSGGKGWAFAVLFSIFVGGAWFSQIDADDWTAEEGSFGAAARDMKRTVTTSAWRLKTSITGGYGEQTAGLQIAATEVARSRSGCVISQAVSNAGPTQVSPIVLAFTFKDPDGSAIGKTVSSSVDDALPPGASRTISFKVTCPEVFASAEVNPVEKALVVSAPAAATAGGGMSWLLEHDSNLPCPSGKSCKVVIRFRSRDSATYWLEQRRFGGARLRATDQRGSELLSMAADATLIVQTRAEGGLSYPIARDGDDRWSVKGAARMLAGDSGSPASGKGT